jgi:hypothetical protein
MENAMSYSESYDACMGQKGLPTIAAHFYLAAAATCLATAIAKESLFSELDDAPDGSFKAAVQSEAREGTAMA